MFWLIAYILIWGVIHSWLASIKVKEQLRKVLGAGLMRGYRAFYNVFAVISLAPILLLMRNLPDIILYQISLPWSLIIRLAQGISAIFLLVALMQTDVLDFAGLRPIIEGEKKASLVTNGFYSFVRHPLYLFGLLILWLTPSMTRNELVLYISLTAYLFLGAIFEERKLLREFGSAYAEYKSRTPMIIPIKLPRWV